MMIEFEVSGKPQGKARPRFSRDGRVYTPSATRAYEKRVRDAYRAAGGKMLTGAIQLEIYAMFAIPASTTKKARQWLSEHNKYMKKPDADNIAKSVADGLNGVAYEDDAQVYSLHVIKTYQDVSKIVVRVYGNA